MNDLLRLNELETRRFGIKCARINGLGETMPDLDAVNREAADQSISMISTRISVNDIARMHALESDGYRLMDTLVYFSGPIEKTTPPPTLPAGLHARIAQPSDALAVKSVAAEAFTEYFGHYQADPRLDNTAADAVYPDWAYRAVKKTTAKSPVLLILKDAQILGFATTQLNAATDSEIILSAVAPAAQGQGMYQLLINTGAHILATAGATGLTVSTQINNYAVQKVWSRAGLLHTHSNYTLHKWFN